MNIALRAANRVRPFVIRGGIRARTSTHTRRLWSTYSRLPCTAGVGIFSLDLIGGTPTLNVSRVLNSPSVGEQMKVVGSTAELQGNDEVTRRFTRLLQRCSTIIRLLLRALSLLAIWTPVVMSSPAVALVGLPFIPRTVSARLRKYWLGALLKVIKLSGPTFIKAAQWASTRRDSFPEEVCRILGELHTFTRHRPLKYGEDAIEAAFGPSWRQFIKLEDDNLGSGCVAQVYKGNMIAGKYKGTPVAIKIINPQLKRTIELDLRLMRGVATLVELLPRVRWLSLPENIDEFGRLMESQLDLRREALNLERFAHDFENDPRVVFPHPLHPWVTETVLIEEFKEGEPISNYFGGSETKQLAQVGLEAFLKMVFLNNFMHGDLHPGNLMVERRKGSGEPCLVILDAGIVCELDVDDRRNFVDLFYAIVIGDGKRAGRLMIERARNQRCNDPEVFCNEVDALVQRARSSGLRLGQIQAGKLLMRILTLCLKHEVQLESKFASVLMAIAVLEGVGRSLDPDCNILQASFPLVTQASATITR